MDGFVFDRLTRALSTQPTRRSLLGLLTVLPLAGIVTAQGDEPTTASGRRHRGAPRQQRKRAGKHRHKRTRQGTVQPPGQCTPSCAACQTCDAATGRCVPVADNTACDDGNSCTGTSVCRAGVCIGRPVANRTSCGGGNICCNGACCSGCCSSLGGTGGTCGSCLAFVTSTTHAGNLGGLDGADAICQDRADAGKLPGSYKAWLSTGDGPNQSPARGRFRQSSQPYALVDSAGTQIAANFRELITCNNDTAPFDCLDQAITLDEVGDTWASGVWTNTGTDGADGRLGADCDNWTVGDDSRTGQSGTSDATTFAWTSLRTDACNTTNRLYCFQQD